MAAQQKIRKEASQERRRRELLSKLEPNLTISNDAQTADNTSTRSS